MAEIQEFEFSSLKAMISVLCCGSNFDDNMEEVNTFLDMLLESKESKVYDLAQETIVLVLEFNPDQSMLLDWVVDRCFTGDAQVADGCFLALATIFSGKLELSFINLQWLAKKVVVWTYIQLLRKFELLKSCPTLTLLSPNKGRLEVSKMVQYVSVAQ